MDESKKKINRENLLFVYLDLNSPINRDLISPLRAINDDVRIYSKSANCLNLLRDFNGKIFLISSANEKELIKEVHDCPTVEAVFILNSDVQLDRTRFPKLVGVYQHSEEFFMALRNAVEWFEQTQFEFFTFENERLFLWLQLWKEFIKPIHPRISSTKERFVDMAENYYRGNTKLLESLDDFDYCYERNEVLQWCFSSPFPSRFLHRALSSQNIQQIDLCHFLITDVSRVLQQSMDNKANRQFYRGMKVTKEGLEKLMKHTGKLICPKGFFICNKSRKAALNLARSSDYRPDLRPVLFKIRCPPWVSIGELPVIGFAGLIVFDVYTTFRVKYVNRGLLSIVKLEPADEIGRNLARDYRMKYKSENVYSLLDQLSTLPKPPAPSSPMHRSSLPSTNVTGTVTPRKINSSALSEEELRVQELVQHGDIDQVLNLYQRLKTQSPRILNTIGQLYADRKGDYNSAAKYYKKAMKIQEKNGDDTTETLTQLGIAHYNRGEFALALACHHRALDLQQNTNPVNQLSIANSLIGIANAQWGQDNLSEAFRHAQQALILNESIASGNDFNLAMNLAVLANIHHRAGDDAQALDFAQRALTILERCVQSDSLALGSVLNNTAAIQIRLGLMTEARYNLDRALNIFRKVLPEGHPKRVTMETNIQLNKKLMKK